jgi:3-dehydroquinate dehydratase
MTLRENDERIAGLCRSVEKHTENSAPLRDCTVPVNVVPDLQSEPEVDIVPLITLNPAAYRRSIKTILVNEHTFFDLKHSIREAILAHEVGHLLCHLTGCSENREVPISECIIADLWACRWGYSTPLLEERRTSYGPAYCDILQLWLNEQEYLEKMTLWYMQKLAGLL